MVNMPSWSAGCAGVITWPINYHDRGKLKAVPGGWDPSARKYLKYDELIFSVHHDLFKLMLDRWSDSFLKQNVWHTVKKRIKRVNKVWDEGWTANLDIAKHKRMAESKGPNVEQTGDFSDNGLSKSGREHWAKNYLESIAFGFGV